MLALRSNSQTSNLARFAYASLLGAWALGFVGWLLKRYFIGKLFFFSDQNGFNFIDFVSFYRCGKMVLTPGLHAIYDPAAQLAAYNAVIAPLHVDEAAYAQYMPWNLLLMAPFALLSLPAAYLVWNLLSSIVALGGLAALLKLLQARAAPGKPLSTQFIVIFLLAVMSSFPTLNCIMDGQTTLLLLGAIALAVKFWLEGKDLACGMMLSIVSLKPQYFLYLLIAPLAARRWKVLLGAALVIAVLLSASIAAFGWPTVREYPQQLLFTESHEFTVFPTWQVSVRGPLSTLLGDRLGLRLTSLLYLALIPWLFRLWQKATPPGTPWTFAVTILAMLVSSPHSHLYDLTLLALPAAVACTGSAQPAPPTPASRWAARLREAFVSFPLLGVFIFIATDLMPVHQAMPFIFLPVNVFLLTGFLRCQQQGQRLPGRSDQ